VYDLSQPADRPGTCPKCRGTGTYRWGATVTGRSTHEGTCFSCSGTGQQDEKQIRRNHGYNKFKVAQIARMAFA
jgi:DnaJ-class molecular chaperone